MVPFVIALFVWYLINAMARAMESLPWRVPRFLRFTLAVLALLGTMTAVVGLLSQNIAQMVQTAPMYQQKLDAVLLQAVGILHLAHVPTVRELLGYVDIEKVIMVLAALFTGVAGKMLIVTFYTGFLLYEQKFFDGKIKAMFTKQATGRRVRKTLAEIDVKLRRYIGIKSLMSAIDSFLTFTILSVADVPFAAFWGVMAFFLHFIPYAGSMVAITMPALIALVHFPELAQTIMVVAALCTSHAFIGHILDPYMMGNNLNLSPVFIISSLAMWGMVWGVPGMFLAIPILAMTVITLSQFPATRGIAVALSKTGVLDDANGKDVE